MSYLLTLIFVILTGLSLQILTPHVSSSDKELNIYSPIPTTQSLRLLSFGHDSFISDLLWLQSVQYVGQNIYSEQFPQLFTYLDRLTDLHPRFLLAYQFGIPLLMENHPTDALKFLDKALLNYPEHWRFRLHRGFTNFYYLSDSDAALKDLEPLLEKPDSQIIASRLYTGILRRQGRHQLAITHWKGIFDTTTEPQIKELAAAKIIKESGFHTLYQAQALFISDNDHSLNSLQDLVPKYLKEIPKLENYRYYVTSSGDIKLTPNVQ